MAQHALAVSIGQASPLFGVGGLECTDELVQDSLQILRSGENAGAAVDVHRAIVPGGDVFAGDVVRGGYVGVGAVEDRHARRMHYEMATGTLPFRGESSGVIFDCILNKAPAPPLRLNPDLPPKLEDVINKCLEKDRGLRYQHASDIRTDLQRLKRDSESTKVLAQASPNKTLKRHRFWVIVATCIAAVALAAVGTWYLRSGKTAQIDSIAVLPFINGSRSEIAR